MLTATVLGSAVTAIDSTVVGIALPAIGHNFTLPVSSLQWVVTAYLVSLAGLLLVGGALGDRYGRRRVFVIGVVWFAVSSLVCAVAPDAGVLIAGRALQGVGGALLTPGSLAILQASFVKDDRARAIGAWSGLGGVATAIGPFVGGFLISAVSWRLIFLINLPLAFVVVVIATRHVPETRDPAAAGPVDVARRASRHRGPGGVGRRAHRSPELRAGPRPWSWRMLGVAAGAFVAFVVAEGRERHPMLPLAIFRSPQFSATNAVTFVVYAAIGGALFLLPVQLQQVSHYSPLEAGTALLPLTAVMLAFSARSGALAVRIGPRLQMAVGPVVVGAGMLLLRSIGPSGDYVTEVLPGVLVLAARPRHHRGAPHRHRPVLGPRRARRDGLGRQQRRGPRRGLVAVALLPALSGLSGHSYVHPAQFAAGFRHAVLIAGAAVGSRGAPGRRPDPESRRRPAPSGPGPCPRRGRVPVCCPLEATPLATPSRPAEPTCEASEEPATTAWSRRLPVRGATMAP